MDWFYWGGASSVFFQSLQFDKISNIADKVN